MTAPKQSIGFNIDLELEYFQPVMEINPNDPASPAVYFPYLPIALNEELPQELIDKAWAQYNADDPLAPWTLTTGDDVIYLDLGDDSGESNLRYTPVLKLARHGLQTVRVFGPAEYEEIGWDYYGVYRPGFPTEFTWYKVVKSVNIAPSERLVVINNINAPTSDSESEYKRQGGYSSQEGFDYREGFLASAPIEGYRDGRFSQLQEIGKGGYSAYKFNFTFGDTEYQKTYIASGARGKFSGNQVTRLGRRTTTIRETLHFAGDTEKSIQYWYDDPVVRVTGWTQFVDGKRQIVKWRPTNYGLDNNFWINPPSGIYEPSRGRTFKAKEPVWGDLFVEYEASYTAYQILYDFKDIQREYEVSAGGIERVGFTVFDYKNDIADSGESLNGNDIGYDQTGQDKDWLRSNKGKPGFDSTKAPTVYLKLINKITFKNPRLPGITLYYTNGRRTADLSFNPPEPDYMDLPQDELPRVAIYEERKRYRRYAADAATNEEDYGEYERVIEAVYLDPLGNITKHRFEAGNDATEDNRPERD